VSVSVHLADVVGREHVLTDPDQTRTFGTDWTGRWSSTPLAVVRPASASEVAAVMRVCASEGVPVVPQGGNTGLVGGSVPVVSDAVVLSTRRLRDLGPIDVARRQVTVGAGVTVADVHTAAARHDLMYGIDLASRDSATIGGTVATNAGGVRVVHCGDTRSQVIGLEAVFADGRVMSRLDALPKDSAGYDLSQLLIGSEGTLAVVTAVRLRLQPALPDDRVTTLVGVPSLHAAVGLLSTVSPGGLLAAEYFDNSGMQLVRDLAGLPHPLRDHWPYYLLIETPDEPSLEGDVDAAVDRRLWTYRERQPEAAAAAGQVHSLDVALPLDQLDDLLDALPALAAPHRVFTFGHLAEGNLHIQLLGATDDSAGDAILEAVASRGGSISSEHGIGRAKVRQLALCRDAAQVHAMAQIKRALDPSQALNPGVLFTSLPPSGETIPSR
jgi:FAD/FMN-containing dehydrogenase